MINCNKQKSLPTPVLLKYPSSWMLLLRGITRHKLLCEVSLCIAGWLYPDIIDDTVGNTLAAASTLDKDVKAACEKTNNVDAAAQVGTAIAKKALEKGINTVVFDRGGFLYAGKVKALAEAAREAGLDF